MRRIGCMALVALCVAPSLVQANPWTRYWATYKAVKHWPMPFVCADRVAARAPFAVQTQNGWRLQNTLGEYHFDPETQQLTEAGRLKVYWIAVEGPLEHRTVFIPRNNSPEITQMRIDAINRSLADANIALAGGVQETGIPAPAWPADQIDAIDRKYRETMPLPRLPKVNMDTAAQ